MTGTQSTTDSSSAAEEDSDIKQAQIQVFHNLAREAEEFIEENLDTEVPTPEADEGRYPPEHIHTPLKPRLDGWDHVKTLLGELADFCEEQNAEAASEEAIAAN